MQRKPFAIVATILMLVMTALTGCATDSDMAEHDEAYEALYVPSEDYYISDHLMQTYEDLSAVWVSFFEDQNLEYPSITPVFVMPGQSVENPCDMSSVIESYSYDVSTCQDTEGNFTITLPMLAFREIWDGNAFGGRLSVYSSMSADVVFAHEFAHAVVNGYGNQLYDAGETIPAINGINNELIADCFAGIWISTLKSRDMISEQDIAAAIEIARVSGDDQIEAESQAEGDDTSHGTSDERITALKKGIDSEYTTDVCVDAYWK